MKWFFRSRANRNRPNYVLRDRRSIDELRARLAEGSRIDREYKEYLEKNPPKFIPAIIRPPKRELTDGELEQDRQTLLAQEEFFSRIRWETHLSASEVIKLKRQPITGISSDWIARTLEQQQMSCFYCRDAISVGSMHKDHLIPLAMWGLNHVSNIVLSCPTCNLEKGPKDPLHFVRSSLRLQKVDQKELLERINQKWILNQAD
jgi:5-methylcytosine-specific restriction endonuclease McrA